MNLEATHLYISKRHQLHQLLLSASNTGSLARISHSSPPPPTSKTNAPRSAFPPSNPTLPTYLTLPTQPQSLTHHQPTNWLEFCWVGFGGRPSRHLAGCERGGGRGTGGVNDAHSYGNGEVPVSEDWWLLATKYLTTPSIQPQAPAPKWKKSEAWRVVTGPQLLLQPAPAWSLRRRAPHLNSPCPALP
jgi:hypothetical protein